MYILSYDYDFPATILILILRYYQVLCQGNVLQNKCVINTHPLCSASCTGLQNDVSNVVGNDL